MFEQALATAVSPDGRSVAITDQGGFSGSSYATYLRHVDEAAPVRLGEGQATDFSPDGRWVLSVVYGPPSRILMLPTGAGQTRELPNPDGLTIPVAALMPDGRRVAFLGSKGAAPLKGYVQNIAGGTARAFTREGVNTSGFSNLPVAPDGAAAWLIDPEGRPALFPIDGGPARPLRGVLPGDVFVLWSRDGAQLYVSSSSSATLQIVRVDLATGTRTPWKDVVPSHSAGVRLSQVVMTPDLRTMVHSYSQLLTNLYVVTGLDASR